MRINKFVAQASGLSRRAADTAIAARRVRINGLAPQVGQDVQPNDSVTLDGRALKPAATTTTILLNKPVGYVCSRRGQGSRTVYELLPPEFYNLKPVGRLDKDSSGLLLLTDDGELANRLTHPRYSKQKVYEVELDKTLAPDHREQITRTGVVLEDGPSRFELDRLDEDNGLRWLVIMQEGRNRQIRRTFAALGYTVIGLHRVKFGDYSLDGVREGNYGVVDS
jgi:23S rRNA pseudouridine2605 synthase